MRSETVGNNIGFKRDEPGKVDEREKRSCDIYIDRNDVRISRLRVKKTTLLYFIV